MARLSPEMAAPAGGATFEICPEDSYQVVLCDVKDEGYKANPFYPPAEGQHADPYVPKVRFIYQTDELGSDGRPYLLFSKPLTVPGTLENERSALRIEMISIMGKKAFDAFLERIRTGEADLDELIGLNGMCDVIHVQSADGTKTYANMSGLSPWRAKQGPTIEVRDYTRYQDRKDVEMPYPSAFEPRSTALAKCEAAARGYDPSAAQQPVTPVPAYPHPEPVAAAPTTAQTTPPAGLRVAKFTPTAVAPGSSGIASAARAASAAADIFSNDDGEDPFADE